MPVFTTRIEIIEPVERKVFVDYDLELPDPSVGITSTDVDINEVWCVATVNGKETKIFPYVDDDIMDDIADQILADHFNRDDRI
jgi:hypothetical protein